MRIAIDFDDTIINTKEAVAKTLKDYGMTSFCSMEEKEEFYKKHMLEIMKNITFKENVLPILNKLAEKHELFIVTARSDYYYPEFKKETLGFISNHKIPIKEVYFECLGNGKKEKCLEIKADLFIDDDIHNCLCVSPFIDTLLFESECEGLKTIKNWEDVLNYIER